MGNPFTETYPESGKPGDLCVAANDGILPMPQCPNASGTGKRLRTLQKVTRAAKAGPAAMRVAAAAGALPALIGGAARPAGAACTPADFTHTAGSYLIA
eukprot:gene12585-biopygen9465